MSRENVEIVRRSYRAFSESHDVPAEFFADNVEMDATDALPDVPVLQDRQQAIEALAAYAEMFEHYRVELEEILHADEDRVVTAVRDGGRIKGSEAEVWNRFFHVFTFREGKIARWSSHVDRGRAREAAGLSE